ncbi:hypothetical protein J2S01_001870 [Pectinatus haikarae]|uniref:Uncharacterized protein n=1 Tax=Pectinatus haikarae TaxID=349096 RepID=A0ABT9Y8H8_9FIRM|nr:hypothetical protein [Pectinatus haikarae]
MSLITNKNSYILQNVFWDNDTTLISKTENYIVNNILIYMDIMSNIFTINLIFLKKLYNLWFYVDDKGDKL